MRSKFHHQRLNLKPEASSAGIAIENQTEIQLARIWEEVLGIESIDRDQNYFDLGGDSSLTVQLFLRIEKLFRVKLPLPVLFEAPTIAELARVLETEISKWSSASLVALLRSGSRPPLFCVHGVSGSVSIYDDLCDHLGSDQPVYGLQAQGFDGTGAPLTTIEDMAARYIEEIRKVSPHGPYFLGGHGMGGTIAFEMAQQLYAGGDKVGLLALMDTMNWSRVSAPSQWETSYDSGQRIAFDAAGFFRLDFRSKFNELARRFRGTGSISPDQCGKAQTNAGGTGSEESVQAKISEANDLACSSYIPKFYPGRLVDFRPMKQYRAYNKAELKWGNLAQSAQEIVLPVYPNEMLTEPFVKYLAVALRQCIGSGTLKSDSTAAPRAAVQVG